MPSPFPGMNPYLEQEGVFHDFHQTFIPTLRAFLTKQVKPPYFVALDVHLYVRELPADKRSLTGVADLGVGAAARGGAGGVASSPSTAVATAPAYARVPTAVYEERSSFLEVRDGNDRSLVTVIELLSRANKQTGPDREQYIAKRRQLLTGAVNFVEIDLLRGGPRLPLDDLPDCDYYALVSRPAEWPRVGIWPVRLRERLPVIPIPLRPPDDDLRVDLQEVLHHVYDEAGYASHIYEGAPRPRLHPQDEAWARQYVPR